MNGAKRETPERWARIEEIYMRVVNLPPSAEARATMLEELCAGDADVRHSVESLLSVNPDAEGFLDTSAVEIAAGLLDSRPDATLIGHSVGPYVIETWLGSGGMGDVYRARDEDLRRQVALKILPEMGTASADSAARLARFKQEGQVLASLSHPNIAGIYGFEVSNGISAIAMELVEGPTLADRLASGPLPLDEALTIARQIAEAIEAAHERGIVHRDLKPSNIALQADGTVKVLDFGLARALHADVMGTAADSTPESERAVFGTPAYVSPEQAKGRPTDKRVDVWAFGALLYELLTGQGAFKGERTTDILNAVLHQPIDWRALPSATPPAVRRLLERCLERDAKRRLRDMGEARIVLEDPGARTELGPSPASTRRRALVWFAAGTLLSVTVGLTWWVLTKPAARAPVTRFTYTLPEGRALALPARWHISALSPDGTKMVYAANDGLYLQPLAELESHPLPHTTSRLGAAEPVFSPDGRSIAFWSVSDLAIKTIPVIGGPAVTVCPSDGPLGLSWNGDDLLFGARGKGIMRVAARGGTPAQLVKVGASEHAHGPQLLPDGRHLLFTIASGYEYDRWEKARVVVQSLSSGERRTILENATDARYVATGHLVYATREGVLAVPFDPWRRAVVGTPVSTIAGPRRSQGRTSGAVQFSVSETGSLIFVLGAFPTIAAARFPDIIATDRAGHVERLLVPPGRYREVRVSRDGRLALAVDDGREVAIYIYDRSGATALQRLTEAGHNRAPIWSADSRHIAFQSDREGDQAIFWQAADGAGVAKRLTTPGPGEAHVPEAWIPTGGGFLFSVVQPGRTTLWTYSMSDGTATRFGDVQSAELMSPAFSPDGRWVAYAMSDPSMGQMSIQVQPFPPTGEKYPLFVGRPAGAPSNSPHKPVWSTKGDELFYVPRIGEFEVVRFTTRPRVTFSNPTPVPRPFNPGPPDVRRTYDIGPDGRFYGLLPTEPTLPNEYERSRIQVIVNWINADARR